MSNAIVPRPPARVLPATAETVDGAMARNGTSDTVDGRALPGAAPDTHARQRASLRRLEWLYVGSMSVVSFALAVVYAPMWWPLCFMLGLSYSLWLYYAMRRAIAQQTRHAVAVACKRIISDVKLLDDT